MYITRDKRKKYNAFGNLAKLQRHHKNLTHVQLLDVFSRQKKMYIEIDGLEIVKFKYQIK